ncbi:MmcB family DNA repair protein [Kaustia mangrovi]|uniref:MmcB family DNA repair protein n=1 Tax=Kaustia mangrovi TaxID=2593653 RepID=A0A7S8C567_9HYPH|nr:MmcB family DNA repair protein [Kaustia mangrovi]QPC43399.1 MmcB family DNA repair protein [Kaustia mangrovi]
MDTPDPRLADGRQSPTAAAVQRGVCRLLRASGFATVTELVLATGRRVDVIALNDKGDIWIVEIKSSLADLRADRKWPEYWEYCDRLFFAVPDDFPMETLPGEAGHIVADGFGADIVRHIDEQRLAAARRKAVTLRFARAAALRLHGLHDPHADGLEQPGFYEPGKPFQA